MTASEVATVQEAAAPSQHWSPEMATKIEYAKALAKANLLPTSYRDNPGNLLYAIEFAEGLQIPTINAITSIHVIEGKPSPSADLMIALARRAGHRVRIDSNATSCTVTVIRADDPEFPFTATWTMDDAKAAELTGKKVWKNYPRAMLRSRAAAEVIRQACSEVLAGMVHTAEELGWDEPDPPRRRRVVRDSPLNDRIDAEVDQPERGDDPE